MWFRAGQHGDSDRFRVSSIKNRIRRRKSTSKSLSTDSSSDVVDNAMNSGDSISAKDALSVPKDENSGVQPPPVLRSPSGRRMSVIANKQDKEKEREKEKVLLTDRKFKNNRVMKSSSKGKVIDVVDKSKSGAAGSATRKVSVPSTDNKAKPSRPNSNLNLNALLRYKSFISNTTKKLTHEDFDRLRRKSITDPGKLSRHVSHENDQKSVDGELVSKEKDANENELEHKNFSDDEAFHSCNEDELNNNQARKSSPSLTARVAARLSEGVTKSKKAKTKKHCTLHGPPSFYSQYSIDRPTSTSVVRQPSDRRPDLNSNTSTTHGHNSNELTTSHSVDTDTCAQDAELENRDSSKSKSAPVSVNRSESYKERLSHKRNRNNRRKTSDPSLSKTNGEQQVELGINNFTASSSSSLSSSLDSPSTSLEAVGAPAGQGTAPAPRQWVDSEDEAGDLEADWSSNVSVEILQTLSDAEKKRQEVINEIYQTEKNHVRTLRLLEGIFMRPLQESGTLPPDHLTLLFPPSLLVLKDIHSSFEQQLKLRRSDHGPLIGDIGDLLLAMFDGRTGDDLREHAAQFCARQQIALEALKEKRRKDEHLQRLLTKAESHKACRRLQLKDLLPTALQRLTKYPLLFESLLKITKRVAPENEIEAQAILCAVESSRRILDHVNQAVRIAEDAHKLQTIQKRLDKSSYEKEASSEFKNLDLTQHKLIYDGPLIMKKNPGVQLHGLLFETMMVLLIKQDDKYILKFQSSPGLGSGESKSIEGRFNPITKINLIFVRQSAVEKNTFFLINTNVSQMLELTAPSSSECKTWFKHISEAAEAYKGRTKGNHDAVPLDDPASVTLSSSSTKESLEGTPEKDLVSGTGASATTGPLNDNQLNNNNLEIQKENAGHHHSNRGDINESNLDNRSGHNGYRNGDSKTGTNDDEGPSRGGSKYRPGDFSNNSNNTRTLTQQSSLVAPTEVHISVSPALTAEPVLTPNERLRRLDESIRLTLVEKQKIVCDMFKVPVEHFSAIADIAGQPEAPKEPSDIVLAAFAQVQSLTETLNDYISISQTQEISAVSTSLCDDCHNKAKQIRDQSPGQLQNQTQQLEVAGSVTDHSSNSSNSSTVITVVRNPSIASDRNDIIADDDGYCEIDEIRLPSIVKSTASPTSVSSASPISMNTNTTASVTVSSSSSSLVSTAPTSISSINITQTVITPDLKRQSTISADSIPEECEHEIGGDNQQATKIAAGTTTTSDHQIGNGDSGEDEASAVASKILDDNDAGDVSTSDVPTASISGTNASNDADEHIEVNDAYDSISQQMSEFNLDSGSITEPKFCCSETCRANRLIHAQSIAPAVPCHLISTYVAQLNSQISQLLPKLNERDIEREKLRKENQHLRDLLNSMHERELVSNDKETPGNGTSSTQESTN